MRTIKHENNNIMFYVCCVLLVFYSWCVLLFSFFLFLLYYSYDLHVKDHFGIRGFTLSDKRGEGSVVRGSQPIPKITITNNSQGLGTRIIKHKNNETGIIKQE